MKLANRREFLKRSGSAVGAAVFASAAAARGAGADQKIVMGIIGPGGMGSAHLAAFAGYRDVAVGWVCDPDENRMREAARKVEQISGTAPRTVKDLRRVLDDKAVDAVVIATPDHWHAPATILALDAGKHVYVEKPCSHNIREGRLMVEAARRNNKVVQVGTQSRGGEALIRGMELLKNGAIGEVLIAKAWNSQLRGNIGHARPSEPPAHLDYDLWVGPAPMVPYQANMLHSSWRWFHAFGAGDAGNDGVHDIDIARWGLGVDVHPSNIAGLGGKYVFDDDQQFPDTQYVVFEYPSGSGRGSKQLIYEHRIWSPYVQDGHENGNAFYGTKGMMILGKKSGWQMYGERNKLIDQMKGAFDLAAHHRDFLECMRTGRRPRADIEVGHLSSALAHLANITTRLGRRLRFDPAKERFIGDEEANRLVRRSYREGHWAVPKGV